MHQNIKYKYSLKFSIATIALMTILTLILSSNVLQVNTASAWLVYGFFLFVYILLTMLLIVKRVIPAIKGSVAIELDENSINDYISDVRIDREDIDEITLTRGRSASTIWINLKYETDHGSRIAIPLRWIKGKDNEIYENVLSWFEQGPTVIN